MTIPTINTELMLLSWRESSSGGASVTFALPDAESLEQFKALTAAKGGKGGQRFMAAMAVLGDDDQPEPIPATEPKPAKSDREPVKKLGGKAMLAVRLCKDPAFSEWVRPIYDRHMGGNGNSWGDVHPEQFGGRTEAARLEAWTRHVILAMCICNSRRDLDTDPFAGTRFEVLIRKPWIAAQEVAA